MSVEVHDWLARFVGAPAFLQKYPYYAAVIARLCAVLDPSVDKAAVSLHGGRFYLHLNAEYFAAHPEHLLGILLHEVHHVVLGHLTLSRLRDVAHPDLMELAMECSANEYIDEPLPSPITWKQFEGFGLRAGQSTAERYALLAALRTRGSEFRPGGAQPVDDHSLWEDVQPGPGAQEQTRDLVRQAIAAVQSSGASESPSRPLPRSARIAGRDPGNILESLGDTSGPPEAWMDWRTALRMFAARARVPVRTFARPSRRFPERVGEVPGRMYASRAVARPTLLVAIDTSLSMAPDDLREVARHLELLRDEARITIAQCDTEVTALGPFEGRLERVTGRGGTDLRPVFAPEILARVRPDGVVYFTDGLGPFLADAPAVPTLWVLTRPEDFDCPWGQRAVMDRKRTAPLPPPPSPSAAHRRRGAARPSK